MNIQKEKNDINIKENLFDINDLINQNENSINENSINENYENNNIIINDENDE